MVDRSAPHAAELLGHLQKGTFESAKRCINGQPTAVKDAVWDLADVFGDRGWPEGIKGKILHKATLYLLGLEG